ncbi:hypothetical protein [Deinococcus misasensis]|uniref:hypothetical protein n=1 Tax=Deinococcus misasensis TaxID=392413 RepID=UPI000553FDD4|nr:hypothetical protein [Deinococcus misasensis]
MHKTPPRVTVYGVPGCKTARVLRAYLETVGIRYTYMDAQNAEGASTLEQVFGNNPPMPIVRIDSQFRHVSGIWELNLFLNDHHMLDFRAG